MKKISFFISLLITYSMNAAVISIKSEEHFDQEAEGMPVVVDFYADWCGPCKMIKPHFEKASEKHKDVKFLSVNGDVAKNKQLKTRYKVRSYPTFVFIDAEGNVVKTKVGAGNDVSFIDKNVAKIKKSTKAQPKAVPTAKPTMQPEPMKPQPEQEFMEPECLAPSQVEKEMPTMKKVQPVTVKKSRYIAK